ncbi:serine/threonine-protein kinase [uncultured Chloroflexus sp.]|uniref:serine/threonine protein kinase n=1 Tax=uncultured Chloroflexus sp. TaxID=214040 RepID=UPI002603EE1D|nr:serine/threonine-protein kinase [uncultured Chloroflexus sp.]
MTTVPRNEVVANRFQVVRLLTRTAHSIVDLAYDGRDKQFVVIKRLAPTSRSLPIRDAARAFLREIKIVHALPEAYYGEWPCFPRFITMGRDRHGYYYVQRYIPGQTLASILAAGHPHDALTIAINLCWVLSILHAHGIIHGDLHPQNIIVGVRGEVALIDFGLSRYHGQLAPEVQGIGRPTYTPPEQWAGWPIDERSDFFALGWVLHELLDGEQLPPSTQALIARMLNPFPANRQVTLAALQAELEVVRDERLQPQPAPQWFINGLIIVSITVITLLYLSLLWR